MEKELRKKLEQEIAGNLKTLLKEKNPAAFDKMEKHIDLAARSLAKRFVKVRNKLMEVSSAAPQPPQKVGEQNIAKTSGAALKTSKAKAKTIDKGSKAVAAIPKKASKVAAKKAGPAAKKSAPAKKSAVVVNSLKGRKTAAKNIAAKK
jgi:hypothetical protein